MTEYLDLFCGVVLGLLFGYTIGRAHGYGAGIRWAAALDEKMRAARKAES